MAESIDINPLLDEIVRETKLSQEEIALKLDYNADYFSQARKKGTKKLYNTLIRFRDDFRKSKPEEIKNRQENQKEKEEKEIGTEDITMLYRQTLTNQQELAKRIKQLQLSLNKLTLIVSGKLVLPEAEIQTLEASLGSISFGNTVQILGENSMTDISSDQRK